MSESEKRKIPRSSERTRRRRKTTSRASHTHTHGIFLIEDIFHSSLKISEINESKVSKNILKK
jgi:hypothetical protein